jgi:hypothetical protein
VYPVIQSGSAPCLLVEAEAEGVDQVEYAACRHSGTANVSRVVGDFWVQKHDVKGWGVHGGWIVYEGGFVRLS